MDFGTNDYELYNLDIDSGERNNLADKYPEKIIELKKLIDEFTKTTI